GARWRLEGDSATWRWISHHSPTPTVSPRSRKDTRRVGQDDYKSECTSRETRWPPTFGSFQCLVGTKNRSCSRPADSRRVPIPLCRERLAYRSAGVAVADKPR